MDSVSVELDTSCNPMPVLCAGSPLAPSMPDQFEPLESIWGKCPVEEPLWATPTSVIDCLLSEPMEDEELPMGGDEMAEWIHCLTSPAVGTQAVAGSSHLLSSELLGIRAAESEYQVWQPVLPDKDVYLDCHQDIFKTTFTINENDSAQDLGGVNSIVNAQSDFEGHSESKNQGSPIESKSSTISSSEKRKDVPQSTRSRKFRTAEIHNLSERRRRNKINERMKALQEIIPRSNKLDKASVLDETIAYVKFLQTQVKMLSRRCATWPRMCPCGSMHMPSRYTCMDMNVNGGMNRPMFMQSGMTSHAPMCQHMNQSRQLTPMFQMSHQHDMAMEMPSSCHEDSRYPFSNIVSGQLEVSSQDFNILH